MNHISPDIRIDILAIDEAQGVTHVPAEGSGVVEAERGEVLLNMIVPVVAGESDVQGQPALLQDIAIRRVVICREVVHRRTPFSIPDTPHGSEVIGGVKLESHHGVTTTRFGIAQPGEISLFYPIKWNSNFILVSLLVRDWNIQFKTCGTTSPTKHKMNHNRFINSIDFEPFKRFYYCAVN